VNIHCVESGQSWVFLFLFNVLGTLIHYICILLAWGFSVYF